MISTVTVPFAPVLVGAIGLTLLQLLLFFVSAWMIFLILIQRGKGGGLTAAFGGGGGDSAFGAKAGDAFTKITIITALVWITLCMVTIAAYNPPDSPENPFAQNDLVEPEDSGPSLGSGLSSEEEAAEAEEAAEIEGESETESSSAEPSSDAAPATTEGAAAGSGSSDEGDDAESTDP